MGREVELAVLTVDVAVLSLSFLCRCRCQCRCRYRCRGQCHFRVANAAGAEVRGPSPMRKADIARARGKECGTEWGMPGVVVVVVVVVVIVVAVVVVANTRCRRLLCQSRFCCVYWPGCRSKLLSGQRCWSCLQWLGIQGGSQQLGLVCLLSCPSSWLGVPLRNTSGKECSQSVLPPRRMGKGWRAKRPWH